MIVIVRPSLSEKWFPVRRVTAKKASREVGIFVFLFLIFIDLIEKKNTFSKNHEKKSQSALFSPPGRWTGNNFLFKDRVGWSSNLLPSTHLNGAISLDI